MIWLFLLMVWWSLNLSIGYLYSQRWIPAAITLAALVMNIGSVVIQVEIAEIDAAAVLSGIQPLTNKTITKLVPYHPGMTLNPGESTVIKIPVDPGTDI